MDRETAIVVYRALKMILVYLEKRYDLGRNDPIGGDYDVLEKRVSQNVIE